MHYLTVLLSSVLTAYCVTGAPASNSEAAGKLTARKIQGMPPNVADDFWEAYEPPSAKANKNESMAFEFLHCDQIWE